MTSTAATTGTDIVPSRMAYPLAIVSGLAIAAAIAFAGWSVWWPHSDMRANVIGLAALVFGGLAILFGWFAAIGLRGQSTRRQQLAWLAMVAVVAVALYAWLVWATVGPCGPNCPPWT